MSTSTFYRFAQQLTLHDICTPVTEIVHDAASAARIFSQHAMGDFGASPIMLVTDNSAVYGWFDVRDYNPEERGNYDVDEDGQIHDQDTISTYTHRLPPDAALDGEETLLKALRLVSDRPVDGWLVRLRSDEVGVLVPEDLYKPEAQLCLLSLLLAMEATILALFQRTPRTSCARLAPESRAQAERLLLKKLCRRLLRKELSELTEAEKREFREAHQHTLEPTEVLEQTSFSDKIRLLCHGRGIHTLVPELATSVGRIVEVRNALAHVSDASRLVEVLPPHEMFPLVQVLLKLAEVFEDNAYVNRQELDFVAAEPEEWPEPACGQRRRRSMAPSRRPGSWRVGRTQHRAQQRRRSQRSPL
jgi:hypothetical protein